MDDVQLGIEAALSLLLIVSIFYSLHLGRALAVLRRDRVELTNLINGLSNSSAEAQAGIDHLRQTTELVGRQLTKTLEHGRVLRGELSVLCTRGEEVANRLEAHSRPAKLSQPGVDPTPPPSAVPRAVLPVESTSKLSNMRSTELKDSRLISKSEAELELIRALRLQRA